MFLGLVWVVVAPSCVEQSGMMAWVQKGLEVRSVRMGNATLRCVDLIDGSGSVCLGNHMKKKKTVKLTKKAPKASGKEAKKRGNKTH